ncbi:MAG TPA: PilZ domain-containing protein [Polyangiales bacterium]|nr:PilZ domain-containing protein [Polyangiales bacterium]
MDVGTNKTRKDTRAVVSLVARYRSPSTFEYVEEACCDVSLGGMFIRSKDPAAAGTLLKLECESGVGGQIRGVARVVWLRAQHSEYGPSGMGVKFVKLDPESKDVITRIVQELAAEGIESPSMSSAPENRGKPPVNRGTSSTPAAADSQLPAAPESYPASHPVVQQRGSDRVDESASRTLVQQRGSDRVDERATAPRSSSKPPVVPRVSSRPAPNDALLAHANVEALDIPAGPSMQDIGRDLSPLAPVMRSGRISSAPPPPDNDRGRAFWLVAGAVVALGVIVAIFSTRSAQDNDPSEQEAKGASPAMQAPPPPIELTPEPDQPDQPSAAEALPATGADLTTQAELAAAPADPANTTAQDTAHAAPSGETAVPAAPSAPDVSRAPSATPTQAEAASAPTSAAPAAAPAASTAKPAATAQPSAPSTAPVAPPPTAAPAAAEVPVLRIVPSEPAAAQPRATAEAPQPPAATPSDTPATDKPAASSTSPASSTTAPSSNTSSAAPALGPGEIAHVIMFTSRPSGASIFVGNQSVVTPGELNVGAMPTRVRVTAQKPGFESSTVWVNNVAEFQKVGGVMRREVHFVLPPLPAGAAPTPNATQQAAPTGATSSAVAPAQPTAPTQAPSAAPSQPPSAAIPAAP